MDKAFVSSVIEGFEPEREAARRAIESLGLRALMAETAPSSPEPSKHALLPLVAAADVVVLILGARYGWLGPSGTSPTEDEYSHALVSRVPVLAFLQDGVDREPRQQEFVDRVSGGWDEGLFRATFSSATDLGFRVVEAIRSLERDGVSRAAQPEAQARALALASGQSRRVGFGGPAARAAFVPVGSLQLLDALTLDDASLKDRLAIALRTAGLVSQAQAIECTALSSAGVTLQAQVPREASVSLTVGADGSVVVDGPVGTVGNQFMTAYSLPRITEFAGQAAAVACAVWGGLPAGDSVRQIALTLSIPEPAHLPLSKGGVVGGSMQLGSVPTGALVAPDPPQVVPRAQVDADPTARLLAVSMKQLFSERSTVID